MFARTSNFMSLHEHGVPAFMFASMVCLGSMSANWESHGLVFANMVCVGWGPRRVHRGVAPGTTVEAGVPGGVAEIGMRACLPQLHSAVQKDLRLRWVHAVADLVGPPVRFERVFERCHINFRGRGAAVFLLKADVPRGQFLTERAQRPLEHVVALEANCDVLV